MDSINKPTYGKKAKFDDQTPLLTRLRYKIFSAYFATNVLWFIFRFVLLLGISYVILLPYFTKISGSFMSQDDFVDVTVKLIPKYPTLDTYNAIINENHYWQALIFTFVLSLAVAIIQMLVCAIVGYGFSKFKFAGRGLIFGFVIVTMIIPNKTFASALSAMFKDFDIYGIIKAISPKTSINLLNTYWPYFILAIGGIGYKNGLFMFMMRQFYKGVPDELEEAAYVDGAGVIKTFFKIIIPMSVPMLVTIFLFSFSWQWTDTFYANIFYTKDVTLLSTTAKTIPQSLIKALPLNYPAEDTLRMATMNTSALLVLIPLVILFVFGQRYLVQGIERTGVTG